MQIYQDRTARIAIKNIIRAEEREKAARRKNQAAKTDKRKAKA